MRVAKENVDVQMEIPGAVIRQRKDFGDVSGFDKISGECFTLSGGVDTTPLFEGLRATCASAPTGDTSCAARSPQPMRRASRRP